MHILPLALEAEVDSRMDRLWVAPGHGGEGHFGVSPHGNLVFKSGGLEALAPNVSTKVGLAAREGDGEALGGVCLHRNHLVLLLVDVNRLA